MPPSNAGDDEMRDTIDMARQVGYPIQHEEWRKAAEEFAALVAQEATEEANRRANASWTLMCEKMVAIEREACAKVAEDSDHVVSGRGYYDQLGNADATVKNIAAAIRARGAKHD